MIESKLNKINESENVILDISNKLDLNLQELSVIKENLKLLEIKNTEQNNLNRRLSTLSTLISDANSQIDELKNKDSESINRERESLKEDAKEARYQKSKKDLGAKLKKGYQFSLIINPFKYKLFNIKNRCKCIGFFSDCKLKLRIHLEQALHLQLLRSLQCSHRSHS